MATYKNISGVNQDTFRTNNSGSLSGKVGKILPNETFEAADRGNVLEITTGTETGRFVYDRATLFALQASVPPTPPVTPPTPPSVPAVIDIVAAKGTKITMKDAVGKILLDYVVP